MTPPALLLFGLLSSAALAADPMPKWAVTADLKVVSLPVELAPAIVPKLNDPATAAAAHAQLRALLQDSQAQVLEWCRVESIDGNRASTETVSSLRYPVEFQVPRIPGAYIPMRFAASIFPTVVEFKNFGTTLEVEPSVSADGGTVRAQFAIRRTALGGWTRTPPSYTQGGVAVSREIPRFTVQKSDSHLHATRGQWYLAGAHRFATAPDTMTLHLIRFTTKPAAPR